MTFGWALAGVCWLLALAMLAMPMDYEGVDSDGDGVEDDCDYYPYDARYADDTGMCDGDASGIIGSSGCCCLSGFLCLLIVDSGRKAKAAAASQIIYVQQQPAQQVVHHHTTHTYVPQKAPVVQQPTVVASATPTKKSQNDWFVEAINLEKARNWEGAAVAYEKAGRYEEAGRVREQRIEKEGAGVNIHVKSGDTFHDSVVMRDESESQNDSNQP